jgi:hypothetical protein
MRVGTAGQIEFEVFQPLTARQQKNRTVLIPEWIIDTACGPRGWILAVRKFDVSNFLGIIVDNSVRLCS